MKKWKVLFGCAVLATAALVSTPALAAPAPKPPAIDPGLLPFEPLDGAKASWGTVQGAGYRIEVPDDWNGGLAINAPGFSGAAELTIGNAFNREHLIEHGYAWASTSYRTTGYNIEEGAHDLKNLVDVFSSTVGKPRVVYAVGGSMGGHVVKHLVEKWPHLTAGALAMCGGDVDLFDYYQDVYLAGEALVGNTPQVPSPADYVVTGLPELQKKLGPAFPDQLNEVGETFKTTVEMLSGGERPVYDQAWSGPFAFSGILVPQTLGSAGNGLDNTDTVYQLDTDPALSAAEKAFNEAMVRVEGSKPQRTPVGFRPGNGQVAVDLTGRLQVPVMALHTLGDLFVPFSMEQIYAQKTQEQGSAGMFVVRAIREPNHCIFTADEVNRAFDDLVAWAETGVRPGGDEVLDPSVVADPAYGCRYTEGYSPTRGFVPACP